MWQHQPCAGYFHDEDVPETHKCAACTAAACTGACGRQPPLPGQPATPLPPPPPPPSPYPGGAGSTAANANLYIGLGGSCWQSSESAPRRIDEAIIRVSPPANGSHSCADSHIRQPRGADWQSASCWQSSESAPQRMDDDVDVRSPKAGRRAGTAPKTPTTVLKASRGSDGPGSQAWQAASASVQHLADEVGSMLGATASARNRPVDGALDLFLPPGAAMLLPLPASWAHAQTFGPPPASLPRAASLLANLRADASGGSLRGIGVQGAGAVVGGTGAPVLPQAWISMGKLPPLQISIPAPLAHAHTAMAASAGHGGWPERRDLQETRHWPAPAYCDVSTHHSFASISQVASFSAAAPHAPPPPWVLPEMQLTQHTAGLGLDAGASCRWTIGAAGQPAADSTTRTPSAAPLAPQLDLDGIRPGGSASPNSGARAGGRASHSQVAGTFESSPADAAADLDSESGPLP